ncbi:MAG: ABC transporter ATP-binding protein [Bacilli bacterium]|nr:ABC transporter ATP-binding protein [Bacilli bacterium]
MLEINSLSKSFADVKAVSSLTLNIKPGINGLVGENGAGKSTLLRIISGVIRADEGDVKIDEYPCESKEAKAKVFFLPDDPYAPRRYNIKQVVDFYSNFYDINLSKFNNILSRLELPENKRVTDFSKGMKRQLFLALAMSIKCDYLLLDEAFDGIDPVTLDLIKQELIRLTEDENKTIVIASHNIESLTQLADHFILLYKGKLSTQEEISDIGNDLVKYQILTKHTLTEQSLISCGIDVVSLKKVGSLYNIVALNDEEIEHKLVDLYQPSLLEKIPLDQDEIVTMEMLLARKKELGHDK